MFGHRMSSEGAGTMAEERTESRDEAPTPPPEALPIRPHDLQQVYATTVGQMLQRADRGWRGNRTLQMMMRQDADISHAMNVREGAASMMPWRIRPIDEGDLEHKARCNAVQRAIEAIPRLPQLRRHIAKAAWYGSSSAHLQYDRLPSPIVGEAQEDPAGFDEDGNVSPGAEASASVHTSPIGFSVIHGDGIRFDNDGNVVLLVNMTSDRFEGFDRVTTDLGAGVRLTPEQRAAFIVSAWNITAPEPGMAETAERMYAGEGLRSQLWDEWLRKQTLAQMGDSYIERFCRGLLIVGHDGSTEGKASAQRLVNAVGVSSAAIVNTNELADNSDLKSVIGMFEAEGTGNQIIMDAIKASGEKLRLCILTQTLTTEAAPTGLGSGVAEAHESTFETALKYDAEVLDEAFTRDLVWPIWRVNFPEDPRLPHFVSQIRDDDEDAAKQIESAERLVNMGVELSQRDLRALGGFEDPQADEPTVGGAGAGGDDLGDLVASLTATGAV